MNPLHFYDGTKPVQMGRLPKVSFRTVSEVTNKYFYEDKDALKRVASDILKEVWEDANPEEKAHFNLMLRAMFKSVREEVLSCICKAEKEEMEKKIKASYDLMVKEPKKDYDAPLAFLRIKARNSYFEKISEYRGLIQSYNWGYKGLDEDAEAFIKAKEKYKTYIRSYRAVKGKGVPCIACNHPCVFANNEICDYCADEAKLNMFARISCFFKLIGSMYLFYWYLPENTLDYLRTHWNKYLGAFKKPFNFNIILRYASYTSKEDIGEKPKEPEEPKKKKPKGWWEEVLERHQELEEEVRKRKKKVISQWRRLGLLPKKDKKERKKEPVIVAIPKKKTQEELEEFARLAALFKDPEKLD